MTTKRKGWDQIPFKNLDWDAVTAKMGGEKASTLSIKLHIALSTAEDWVKRKSLARAQVWRLVVYLGMSVDELFPKGVDDDRRVKIEKDVTYNLGRIQQEEPDTLPGSSSEEEDTRDLIRFDRTQFSVFVDALWGNGSYDKLCKLEVK